MDFFKKLLNKKQTSKTQGQQEKPDAKSSFSPNSLESEEHTSDHASSSHFANSSSDRLSKPLINNDLSPINPLTGKYEFDELDDSENSSKIEKEMQSRYTESEALDYTEEPDSSEDLPQDESEKPEFTETNETQEMLTDELDEFKFDEGDFEFNPEQEHKDEMGTAQPDTTEFSINESEVFSFSDSPETSTTPTEDDTHIQFEQEEEQPDIPGFEKSAEDPDSPTEELEELNFDQPMMHVLSEGEATDEIAQDELSEEADESHNDLEELKFDEKIEEPISINDGHLPPNSNEIEESADKTHETISFFEPSQESSSEDEEPEIAPKEDEIQFPEGIFSDTEETVDIEMDSILSEDIENTLAGNSITPRESAPNTENEFEIELDEHFNSEQHVAKTDETSSNIDDTSVALEDLLKIRERYSNLDSNHDLPQQNFEFEEEKDSPHELEFEFDTTTDSSFDGKESGDMPEDEEFTITPHEAGGIAENSIEEQGIPEQVIAECKLRSDSVLNELLESHGEIEGVALITNEGVSVTNHLMDIKEYDKTMIQMAALRKFADVLDAGLNLGGIELLRLHGSERTALLFDAGGRAVLAVWVGPKVPLGMIVIESKAAATQIGNIIRELVEA
ncbi:MAG: hypothetical protein H6696_03725 [Deferribacteres bacterium]|nr:hypothetical protein [candidate division KSB1 bacterium]MCB9501021.1 hypothetical protein [Deferribacteres bacterium]